MTNTTLMGLMEAHSPHFSKGQRRIAEIKDDLIEIVIMIEPDRVAVLCVKRAVKAVPEDCIVLLGKQLRRIIPFLSHEKSVLSAINMSNLIL